MLFGCLGFDAWMFAGFRGFVVWMLGCLGFDSWMFAGC
jgi:hypothetical protein